MSPDGYDVIGWPFSWKCPKCNHNNKWAWEYYDVPVLGDSPILMTCDKCKLQSKMRTKMVEVKGGK